MVNIVNVLMVHLVVAISGRGNDLKLLPLQSKTVERFWCCLIAVMAYLLSVVTRWPRPS